ncbi:aminomethyltransferase, mitochondrial [Pectinophora gossypiella]|uniref:aminomethyltransferase, mitochondrial n=1 Tax=Pectinophora gossypiella TaxID=13191 RepID=UPI00214E1509|nr:aminomethyltransferase, mitochondrial [Pectinophora gossypiella]
MSSISMNKVFHAAKISNTKVAIPKIIQLRMYSESGKKPVKTPLYDLHSKYGGKLVDFAGFLLPVQYNDMSVSASHLFTRKSASIFDVSHMLQTKVRGKDCVSWFESICPVDLQGMPDGSSSLTVFLNQEGGIIDDLIVTKVNDKELYVVSNAGRLEVDKEHMKCTTEMFKKQGKDVHVEFWNTSERALIALQGPKAASVLQELTDIPLKELLFMTSRVGTVAGVQCRVTRCGYTGEDGVEISIPADKAERVTEALLLSNEVKLAGLGARDSLRLEAGLCLYGNDIDESITPVEASLTWLIAKRRRQDAQFPGSNVILRQIKEGVSKRRVGIRIEEGAPGRKDAALKNPSNSEVVGKVTSGCPSPSLGGNVAMGYVAEGFKKSGTELLVNIRGKDVPCVVAKMPFVPSKYYIKK